MDIPTRVAIGGGIGIAVFFYFLPQLVPHTPTLITYSGAILGLLISIWGLLPVMASLSLGNLSLWRIPLSTALQVCFEKCEGTFVGRYVKRSNDTPHKILSYFWASFSVTFVPVFGECPPSSISRRIPKDVPKRLVLKEGTNDLLDLYDTKKTLYKNAYVRRSDLWKHVRYLKRMNLHDLNLD